MSNKEREPKVQELIADFLSRIEGLKRDGLPYEESTSGFVPWADAPEELKLEQIVGSAQSVETADGERMIVPGTVVLEVVERDVDYTKLPEWQRNSLQELRVNVTRVEYPDLFIMKALELLVGKWWTQEDQRHNAE